METIGSAVLVLASVALATATGFCLWQEAAAWKRRQRHRSAVVGDGGTSEGADARDGAGESVPARIIVYAATVSQRVRSPLFHGLAPLRLRVRPWPESQARSAGVGSAVSQTGFWEARVRLALGGTVAGFGVGVLVTAELGCLLGCVGTFVGWRALPWAFDRQARRRAWAMERDLSEMLDVMALGLHSGMSFDRSLALYSDYFRTPLSAAFRSAHRQWSCGLASRADALREVAASYASPLLDRVVENIVRSLRFGSTLADNLEDAAREARADYKARRQEEVAKAPVKMMVPTGVLILPAMLMLVLGPVLLELASGF